MLDPGSFDGSNQDPFLLLRQDSRPNFLPNPRSAVSAGVEASPRFLDKGLPDKILPQLEELVPVPNFVNFPGASGHTVNRKSFPQLDVPI